jgi:hypothetical protein
MATDFLTRSVLCVIVACIACEPMRAAAQETVPPRREMMPRPEWQTPGPMMSEAPGAQMPGADPFQLLENSKQVQDDLHLTQQQISHVALASRLFRTKLQELSSPKPGLSKEQAEADIQRHVTETRGTIARELSPSQLARLQQIMLQLEGPCMAVMDPQVGQQLSVTPEQIHALTYACKDRATQMRQAFRPPSSLADFCPAMISNRDRVEQVRTQADDRIVALLSPQQRGVLDRMAGKKLALEPPMPPQCQ